MASKKVDTTKKTTTKKSAATVKKSTAKKAEVATKKTTAKKSSSAVKKSTAKKAEVATKKATAKKSSSSKKAVTKKTTTKKASTERKPKTSVKEKTVVITPEYYDLPYHYNQTVVKVLAQTPKTLFVYWDVSIEDTENYIKRFGSDFFNNTIPFLRIHNNTAGTSFDVDVDDFANGWYIHVDESKADYSVELLRKQRLFVKRVIDNPVFIATSNQIETPNDHILIDESLHTVFFRNIKTGKETSRDISNISLLKRIGKIYNIYDLYKKIYKSEDIGEIFDLNNPGSGNPTSTFK